MSDNAVDDTVLEHADSAPAEADVAAATTALSAPTALSDLLVEDVSIDGMCGVY